MDDRFRKQSADLQQQLDTKTKNIQTAFLAKYIHPQQIYHQKKKTKNKKNCNITKPQPPPTTTTTFLLVVHCCLTHHQNHRQLLTKTQSSSTFETVVQPPRITLKRYKLSTSRCHEPTIFYQQPMPLPHSPLAIHSKPINNCHKYWP